MPIVWWDSWAKWSSISKKAGPHYLLHTIDFTDGGNSFGYSVMVLQIRKKPYINFYTLFNKGNVGIQTAVPVFMQQPCVLWLCITGYMNQSQINKFNTIIILHHSFYCTLFLWYTISTHNISTTLFCIQYMFHKIFLSNHIPTGYNIIFLQQTISTTQSFNKHNISTTLFIRHNISTHTSTTQYFYHTIYTTQYFNTHFYHTIFLPH